MYDLNQKLKRMLLTLETCPWWGTARKIHEYRTVIDKNLYAYFEENRFDRSQSKIDYKISTDNQTDLKQMKLNKSV